MKRLLFLLLPLLVQGCIGDDVLDDTVTPTLSIINPIDTLALDSSYIFRYQYTNEVGAVKEISTVVWSSASPASVTIDASGKAKALALGQSVVSVETTLPNGVKISDSHTVIVGKNTVEAPSERTGSIKTTSSYELKGNFVLKESDGKLLLSFGADYKASSNLPGLYVYLTNNPNSVANAVEIGPVKVFNGAHSYTIANIGLRDYQYLLYYCKPFSVKVGDGKID